MTGSRHTFAMVSLLVAAATFGIDPATAGALARTVQAKQVKKLRRIAIVPLSAQGGIGFDDLLYVPALHRVLAPAGKTGQLALLEPRSRSVTSIVGFARSNAPYTGGHAEGVTSADASDSYLFAVDRTTTMLVIAFEGKIASRVVLKASPDYVRYVAPTKEIWVTEPDLEQIEIFAAPPDVSQVPVRVATIAVPGGPESLVIDHARARAYTHLWKGHTAVIDIKNRQIEQIWSNGCESSRGIAFDEKRGLLFAACSEGRVVALDTHANGRIASSVWTGAGVDVIAYSEALGHVYAPAARGAVLTVLSVTPSGELRVLARTAAPMGAHCAAADNERQVWLCDPEQGRLIVYKDDLPASP